MLPDNIKFKVQKMKPKKGDLLIFTFSMNYSPTTLSLMHQEIVRLINNKDVRAIFMYDDVTPKLYKGSKCPVCNKQF